MNKLHQLYPGIEPGLPMYELDALAIAANLALVIKNEI